jgi:hypothetical protein
LKGGNKEEMRRLVERVLKYELEAASLYDNIIAGLKNEEIKGRIAGLRDSEVKHAEMARKELRRFQ